MVCVVINQKFTINGSRSVLKNISNNLISMTVLTASLAMTACGGGGADSDDLSATGESVNIEDNLSFGAATDGLPDSESDNEASPVSEADLTDATAESTSEFDSVDVTPDSGTTDGSRSEVGPVEESNAGGASTEVVASAKEEVAAKEEPAIGLAEDFELVATPSGVDPFSKFQLEDAVYTNNVYDGRQLDAENSWKLIFYNGVQDFVEWEVPGSVGDNADPCARSQSASPVSLNYRLTSRKDSPTERNTFVRAFPAMVVGSMGGRYESWGVECGQAETILPSVQRHGGSPVFQMENVADATGLPVLAGDLDFDIKVSVKADLIAGDAASGLANIFMDSYWHNVSDVALIPGSEPQLLNTINGISSDFTEVWNLNIWFDYPRSSGQASSWTGGYKIGSVALQEGGDFDVYFKIEGSRDKHLPLCRLGTVENCFLYIGLVSTDDNAARNGMTVNYTEISDWMRSTDFRDLFLTGAFESDTPAARAFAAWKLIDGTDNDFHPDPAKQGPRFPDENHVIGGLHLGAELWYNPDAVPASIEFEALGVEVEGKGTFGRFVNY